MVNAVFTYALPCTHLHKCFLKTPNLLHFAGMRKVFHKKTIKSDINVLLLAFQTNRLIYNTKIFFQQMKQFLSPRKKFPPFTCVQKIFHLKKNHNPSKTSPTLPALNFKNQKPRILPSVIQPLLSLPFEKVTLSHIHRIISDKNKMHVYICKYRMY